MYEPIWNSVLVEVDNKEAEWGAGNDESMLGASYSKGRLIQVGDLVGVPDHPIIVPDSANNLAKLKGKRIMWNEGTEAGTLFEFDGKLFGMIYWWDIRGVLVDAGDSKA